MLIVPVQAIPNQSLQVQLADQPVVLNIRQLLYGLFVDVYLGATPICLGVVAENRNRIVRAAYSGFIGDLAFADTQGDSDPVYDGLGSRFQLVYLEAADVAAIEAA